MYIYVYININTYIYDYITLIKKYINVLNFLYVLKSI